MKNRGTFQRIGLLAGAGEIPVYFARKAKENGIELVSIAFSDDIDSNLMPFVDKHYSIGLGQSGKIFETFKKESVRGILMLGKVDKSIIFKPQLFDLRSLKALKRLTTQEDKSLLNGVIEEMEKEGFDVEDCMCESCRKNKSETNNLEQEKERKGLVLVVRSKKF